jgi:hypothetical protein
LWITVYGKIKQRQIWEIDMWYKITIMLKSIYRRLQHRFGKDVTFHTYGNPEDVGGWRGWYENVGRCIAFEDTEGNILYRW